jgi:hypothetical protein
VDTAAHEQIPGQRARRWMLDRLVDLELAVARSGLEEEVVRKVLDDVAPALMRTGGRSRTVGVLIGP